MIEESRDCAEILDFVFGFNARKRQRHDEDEVGALGSQYNSADGVLSQDSVPAASLEADVNGAGQFKRPFNKWSAKSASSKHTNAAQVDGVVETAEVAAQPEVNEVKGDKVTVDGFKIPLATTPLKKGEFESPYRHYKLETKILPHHLTPQSAAVSAKSELGNAANSADSKAVNS